MAQYDPTRQVRRAICPNCSYPTVRLAGFDGTWSGDAVRGEERNPVSYFRWGWPLLVYDLLRGLFKVAGKSSRKAKIERLQQEVLPDFPDSCICPDCLHVIHRRE